MTRVQKEKADKKAHQAFLSTLTTNFNIGKYDLTKNVVYNYGDYPPKPNANESIKHLLK